MALTVSILEIIKQAAIDVGLEEPSTAVANTNPNIKVLLRMAVKTGEDIISRFFLPELKKNYSFTTTASDNQYTLPGDFYRMISGTQWDQSNNWMMTGPLSDQEWNAFQFGIISSISRKRFRIFGSNSDSGAFFIDPTPDATDTVSFDYIRSQWIMPKAWAASEAVTSGTTYRSANGNIYLAQTTASTGSTRPSHTSGTASDGTVSWLYVTTQTYGTDGRFQADTDFPLIDKEVMVLGVVWRFLQRKKMNFAEDLSAYETRLMREYSRLTGSPIISMAETGLGTMLSYDNVPEGDFGQ